MTFLYSICAILGCSVLLCQFVLSITGLVEADDLSDDTGYDASHVDHGDSGHHASHGSHWFFGVVSFRTMTAALAFFGLMGLALGSNGVDSVPTLAAALVAGLGAMYLVHWMMKSLALLKADGTVRIEKAVGATGTVYIRIPGHRSGAGKVQLTLQSKIIELDALTERDTLPTGAKVVVTRIVGSDAVEVALLGDAA